MVVWRGLRWILAAVAILSLGGGDCGGNGRGPLGFLAPAPGQLSLPGNVDFSLRIPPGLRNRTLEIYLDDVLVSDTAYAPTDHGIAGTVEVLAEGEHTLVAVLSRPGHGHGHGFGLVRHPRTVRAPFEIVDLANSDDCEVLNDEECLLPWPSSRFLADSGGTTETGFTMQLPAAGMPAVNGPPLDPTLTDGLDGFSPTAQILMHFPGGVDLAASGASILKAPGCCGQVDQTPYVGVRTHDDTSRDADSPTVLIDAATGEHILHWLENDAHAEGSPRQLTFLRPGVALLPGHRYIVAVRSLVHPGGAAVEPEPAFRALRDALPTTIDGIEARRAHFETEIFPVLSDAGVGRSDLVLAFDFSVRSETQLTSDMLALRDDALAYVDAPANFLTLLGSIQLDTAFNDAHVDDDCQTNGNPVWRQLRGRIGGPYYLTASIDDAAGNPLLNGAPVISRDAAGNPQRNGTRRFNFDLVVPCRSLDGSPDVKPVVIGHGLFGTGGGTLEDFASEAVNIESAIDFDYLLGATDYRGLSSYDLLWLGLNVIGVGSSALNHFQSFPDRLKQGMVNTLVLAHLMKSGFFNFVPQLQVPVGSGAANGVFPGSGEDLYYIGNSLGGIMGLFLAALTPDIERFNTDIGSMNFSLLLQRSTQFSPFETLLAGIGITDHLQTALGIGILHEMWVTSEPAAYVRHIVDDPLPGSIPKKILMTVAWLDKQVSNQGSAITVRSMGLPNLEGSVQSELVDIPDVPGGPDGLDSAMVIYDGGSFDVFDPAYDAVITPLTNEIADDVCDPHGQTFRIPASLTQLAEFLRPDGAIHNFCTDDGVCNASESFETPGGVAPADVCDPLP